MSAKRFFAADLGASGGKCFAGVFDGGKFSLTEVHRFSHECVSFFMPDDSGRIEERAYWDDTLIYSNIIAGLHAYRREAGDSLDSIGIDAWGADGQFVCANGDVFGKMYAYRDHRLDGMVEQVKSLIDERRMYEITGIHFQPFNISNQLCWFMRNRKGMLRGKAVFLPAPSLFYYYLGGVKFTDSTWASVTQLMDARSKKWSGEILAKLGIPRRVMPKIVKPGRVTGALHAQLAASLRLPPAALVSVGSHDTASAFAAAPVADAAEALIISSGTWSIMGRLIPEPITSAEARSLNLSNEGGIGNIRLLKNCMGGWLVHELRRKWRETDGREMDWREIYDLAEAAPPFAALIDPDAPGFYNPPDMEKAMADFCAATGQTMPAGRGGVLRMVYESLALKCRMNNADISRVCGAPSKVVHIVGGGSRNRLLNRFIADALDLPVIAGPVEATAVGNVMVQAMGMKVIPSLRKAMPIIKNSFAIEEYRPSNPAPWEKAYERFARIAPAKTP